MPIAVFGNKTFKVDSDQVYTFNGLKYSSSLLIEKQDADGKKPSTYTKGPGLDTLSFTVPLNVDLGVNPRKEMEDWISMKDAQTAYPFVLGSKQLGANKFRLVDVQPSDFIVDNNGNILSMELGLSYEEYVRPGSAQSNKSSNANYSPGISLPSVSGDIGILAGNDKAYLKRKNSGMKYDV